MLAATDLFDPRHSEGVRRPLLDAETLPAWCYTSPVFYRREVERTQDPHRFCQLVAAHRQVGVFRDVGAQDRVAAGRGHRRRTPR